MKFTGKLNKELIAARREVRAAKSKWRRTLRKVQSECNHEFVVESDWKPGEWLGASPAARVCLQCGYEETEKYGDWPGTPTIGPCSMEIENYEAKTILNTEFVKKVDNAFDYRIR